jgi:hypothetical protein
MASQGYDVLGFIYEYLISMFAANAGKKAGEFYTPHEVSVLMSEVIALPPERPPRPSRSTTPPAARARCCSTSARPSPSTWADQGNEDNIQVTTPRS